MKDTAPLSWLIMQKFYSSMRFLHLSYHNSLLNNLYFLKWILKNSIRTNRLGDYYYYALWSYANIYIAWEWKYDNSITGKDTYQHEKNWKYPTCRLAPMIFQSKFPEPRRWIHFQLTDLYIVTFIPCIYFSVIYSVRLGFENQKLKSLKFFKTT